MDRETQKKFHLRAMEVLKRDNSFFLRGDFYCKSDEGEYVTTGDWMVHAGEEPTVPEFIDFLRKTADFLESWWDKYGDERGKKT